MRYLGGMRSRGLSRKGSAVYVLLQRPENTGNPGSVESEAGGKEVWMRSAKKCGVQVGRRVVKYGTYGKQMSCLEYKEGIRQEGLIGA